MEKLITLDQNLFTFLNGNGPGILDGFMTMMSSTWIWIPVYLWTGYVLIKRNQTQGVLGLLFIFLTLALTEQLSVHGFKEVFQRLRPCHEPSLQESVRLVTGHCGGQFGFVSTHATNAFGFLIISSLIMRDKTFFWSILAWAIILSYSRIHLGVHYPGDILGGIILGLIIGLFTFAFYQKIAKAPIFNEQKNKGS